MKKEIVHGTTSGYSKKCRCTSCRDANSEYERERRSRKNPNRKKRWPFNIAACRMCGIQKTEQNTGKNSTLGRFNTYCKKCDNKRGKEYRKNNPLNMFKRDDFNRGFGENDLTLEFIVEAFKGPCFYCGTLKIGMTLDRIDNTKGHTRDNVIPSCKICNFFRKDMPFSAWEKLIPGLHNIEKQGLLNGWSSCPKTFRMER